MLYYRCPESIQVLYLLMSQPVYMKALSPFFAYFALFSGSFYFLQGLGGRLNGIHFSRYVITPLLFRR